MAGPLHSFSREAVQWMAWVDGCKNYSNLLMTKKGTNYDDGMGTSTAHVASRYPLEDDIFSKMNSKRFDSYLTCSEHYDIVMP